MAISVLSAAKHMGGFSRWTLTHLELQKLLYLSHMMYLGTYKKPLVKGSFEAWAYGPVHPVLYHKAKIFGSDPVEDIIFYDCPDIEIGKKTKIMDRMVDKLGQSGARLIAITHWQKGAWAKNYRPDTRHCIIPNSDILEEYRARARFAETNGTSSTNK